MNLKTISIIIIFSIACVSSGRVLAEEAPSFVYTLSLDEVSRLALENNFDVQLAKFDAQIKATDLDRDQSIFDTVIDAEIKYKNDQFKQTSSIFGSKSLNNQYNLGVSKKLPTGTTVDVDFTNDRTWTNSSFATLNPAYDSRAKLGITQDLGKNFFGLQDRSRIKITKIDIENAGYTSLDKIEAQLAATQKAYFQVVLALKSLEIKQEILSQAEELYGLHKDKIQDGLVEEPALLASEANLRQRESDVLLAKNEVDFSINQLKFALNLNQGVPDIVPKDGFSATERNAVLDESLRSAFASRRDYESAKNSVEAKEIQLVIDKNNRWPEINLQATYARNGIDSNFSKAMGDITSEDNPELYVGFSISIPLENRLAESGYDKAQLEKAKAILSLKRLERLILTDLVDRVRDTAIRHERLMKQRTVAEIQESKLKAEEKRFKYGRSDTDTIIRYQGDALTAKLLAEQAAYEYQLALIDLSVAENTLLNKHFEGAL
ncbi:TolC family protein [Candidatus Omnitrophota bacterium]